MLQIPVWLKYLNQKFGTDIKPGDNVLDFGCGTGTVTLRIAQNANKVYGVDFSEGMLKRARQNLNRQRIENTDFFSITTLYDMFEENYFDVVTIFNVLQYIDNRRELLKQFYALLRPSGILIIVAPCFGETNSFSSFFVKFLRFLRIMPETCFFTSEEIEKEIAASGFTIVQNIRLSDLPDKWIVAKKIL